MQKKACALSCVIGWSAFWTFGYLAVSASPDQSAQASIAAVLAAIGFLTGMFTYVRLGRDQSPAGQTLPIAPM